MVIVRGASSVTEISPLCHSDGWDIGRIPCEKERAREQGCVLEARSGQVYVDGRRRKVSGGDRAAHSKGGGPASVVP